MTSSAIPISSCASRDFAAIPRREFGVSSGFFEGGKRQRGRDEVREHSLRGGEGERAGEWRVAEV